MSLASPPGILAGLIGAGIQASRTPALHEHEGDALGIRYLYRLIDLDALKLDIHALPELAKISHKGVTGVIAFGPGEPVQAASDAPALPGWSNGTL